jgi:hypothetical protein
MKKIILLLIISFFGYGQIPTKNTFLKEVEINSLTTNTSGLRFLQINNISPSVANAKPLGVDANGYVVPIQENFQVNLTPTTPEITQTVQNDQLFINNSSGIILTAPDGTKYKITVNNNGTLNSQLVN